MQKNFSEVVTLLDRIVEGGDASFEEVQLLNWQASKELDPFMQRIYRELQMFASDSDIREKDADYDSSWRRGLNEFRHQLMERISK